MTKPIGPKCNLDCQYCFYLEKTKLFAPHHQFRMPDDVLEQYVRHYIESQPTEEVVFSWQGGEPTLLGVGFFEKAVAFQKQYGQGRKIQNSFQTNGTLIDDAWGRFLRENDFLVGISIDGPAHLHDVYRVDRRGKPTFDKVLRGLEKLQQHEVDYNTLTVVNRLNAKHPKEVYRFLKGIGSRYLQFIPLVEREIIDPDEAKEGCLADPPQSSTSNQDAKVTDWSVRPFDYGEFLTTIFRHWVKKDVGKIFVQMFDTTLGNYVGAPPSLCVFSPRCGNALAMEHNGDVYACDHYVYEDYRLGNVMEQSLASMIQSPQQKRFGEEKTTALPGYCLDCRFRFACHGGCPKHRFLTTTDGEPGLNYLCAGYRHFFKSTRPWFESMRDLYRQGKSPALIMKTKVNPNAGKKRG